MGIETSPKLIVPFQIASMAMGGAQLQACWCVTCLRVRAAFLAEAERCSADRLPAALCAWRYNALREAAPRLSRFRAVSVARDRLAETLAWLCPRL
jgi:hypothetical protein